MKYTLLFILSVLLDTNLYAAENKEPTDYVNPFICTLGDHGQWHPAALVPFGTVKVGPDTYPGSLISWGGCAHGGYNYSDSQIRGFSHFKQGSSGGGGITDRAGIFSILPYSKERNTEWYRTPVMQTDKKKETARAGYYSTFLSEDGILAEMTANTHSAFHRYTFSGSESKILITQGNLVRTKEIGCRLIDEHSLEGHVDGFFFYMTFNHKVTNSYIKDEDGFLHAGDVLDPKSKCGFVCSFGNLNGQPLYIKVGISLTSAEAAKMNYEKECANANFEASTENAKKKWNNVLKRIEVEGSNEELKTIFYTALYHACFFPVSFTNVDGTYFGLDWNTHKTDGYVHYSGYAIWDSFRSKYPLFSLFVPEIYSDITQSLYDQYTQTDFDLCYPNPEHKPHGDAYVIRSKKGGTWINCRHEHMLMLIADAYSKGLLKPQLRDVYPFMRKEAMTQMPEKYDSIGFIPARPDQTGDYSWDSWCMAYAAKETGNFSDYQLFSKRADYWKNTWDPDIRFFRARAADGTWLDFPSDPTINREKYTYEGSKWHLRWNVLHDVPGLIKSFGGKKMFLKELNYFFDHDLYTAGNQIDLHVPFFFNIAGEPWQTQKWVYRILTQPMMQRYGTHGFLPTPVYDRIYRSTPDGYLDEMDDDYGCMSSWFVLGAMGLYQICAGQPVYQISTPIFDKITIHLQHGKTLEIRAVNTSADNFYIQSASLNGHDYQQSSIGYNELINGGILEYHLGNSPNKKWGRCTDAVYPLNK
jgi:predicted alpha-1,2-mannosidase